MKQATQRINRTSKQVRGTAGRPRLAVNISNQHVQAQVINDQDGRTLAHSSSAVSTSGGPLTKKAAWVGEDIAKKAKKAKVSRVVLDRRGKPYHGRVAALAEAARKQGLEF